MPDISCFISYSRQDETFAARLSEDLQSAGADTWRDREDIPAGANWDHEIEQAIRACTHFLLIASPQAVESKNVLDELGLALDKEKPVFPVLVKDCDLPMRVRRAQWVDFRQNYEAGLRQLAEHLNLQKELVPRSVYKPHLDKLFEGAEALMAELIAQNGNYFTNQQFLKEAARRNPIAYIELLNSTKQYIVDKKEDPKWIFNLAHQAVGGRLGSVAKKAGYKQVKRGREELDIWGKPTNRIDYYQE